MDCDRVVAVALLSRANMRAMGKNLERVYSIEEVPAFGDLLAKVHEVERARGKRR